MISIDIPWNSKQKPIEIPWNFDKSYRHTMIYHQFPENTYIDILPFRINSLENSIDIPTNRSKWTLVRWRTSTFGDHPFRSDIGAMSENPHSVDIYIYIHVCIYNYVLYIYICMISMYDIYIYILKDNVNVVAIVAWMCSESTLQTTGHQLARIVNYAFIFHARAWTCDKGHDLRLRFRVQNPQWFWENWCVEWWRILVRNNPNHVRKQ